MPSFITAKIASFLETPLLAAVARRALPVADLIASATSSTRAERFGSFPSVAIGM